MATACALVLLLSAAAFAYPHLTGHEPVKQQAKKRKALTVSGSVENLQPGVPTVLTAMVRNNLSRRVRLRSLKATIGDANAACPRSMLYAQPVRARKAVRAHRPRRIPVTVTLLATAPVECQNARFPIRYTVRAQAAGTAP
jgi:hypothetical protein